LEVHDPEYLPKPPTCATHIGTYGHIWSDSNPHRPTGAYNTTLIIAQRDTPSRICAASRVVYGLGYGWVRARWPVVGGRVFE
jgi:hypothetical protein